MYDDNVVATVLEILSAIIFLKPGMQCKLFLTLQILNRKWGWITKFQFGMFISKKDILQVFTIFTILCVVEVWLDYVACT